jgi:hypothetical protein
MDIDELANRFRFHPATTDDRARAHEWVRDNVGNLAAAMNGALPEGREKALVMTHLEEVMMWANAAIARQPDVPEQAPIDHPV